MRYKVPRHIEHETKIVGPASFKQLTYLGGAAFVIFFLYLILNDISMTFFYFASVVVAMAGFALAFLKVNGIPLPQYIKNYITFSTSSREYVWKKKEMPFKISTERKKREPVKEKEKKEEGVKKESKLSKIGTRIETS